MLNFQKLTEQWRTSLTDLSFQHHDPEVRVQLSVVERGRHVKILFTLNNLKDSTSNNRFEAFEYYFYVDQWPGDEKARLWILSAWDLLMEHEELELTGKDPHNSDQCAEHRARLDRRHDMSFMTSRLDKISVNG